MALETILTADGYQTNMVLPVTNVNFAKDANDVPVGLLDAQGQLVVNSNQFGRVNTRRKDLVRQRNGLLRTVAATSGSVKTYLNQLTLAGHCVAVQIGVLNAHPTSTPQCRVKVGFTESAPASGSLCALTKNGVLAVSDAEIDAGYVSMTINGNNTPSLKAFTGATIYAPYANWFDIYPITSLRRTDAGRELPVMNVITELFAYQNNVVTASTFTEQYFDTTITGWETDDPAGQLLGNFYRSRSGAVAGGVSPHLMNQTAADTVASAAILIRYFLATETGIQVVMVGDSTREGSGGTIDKFGGTQRAVFAASTLDRPIELLNAAQAGTTPDKFASMAQVMVPEVPNAIFIHPIGSVNLTMPLANYVSGAAIVNAGSGGTPGAATLTGTTGTGTKFQIAATIGAGGTVTALGAVTTVGAYTVLPTDMTAEPVTGGSVTGCTLSLRVDSAIAPLWKRDIAAIEAAGAKSGCALIPHTWMPATTGGRDYLGSDPIRRAYNDALRDSGRVYIDSATALEGATVGNQVQFVPAYTTDLLHPNDAGYAQEAPLIESILGLFTGA